MYSQSRRIPTDCITNSHITFIFFVFLPRLEAQNNGTPRIVLVSCLLLT